MARSPNIYTAHEKLDAAEPTERVELVREGFAYWAFVFGVFWLAYHRLWLELVAFIGIEIAIAALARAGELAPTTSLCLQLLLQLLLAAHARDLLRMKLLRHGYREAGVIVADSPIAAEQRYYANIA